MVLYTPLLPDEIYPQEEEAHQLISYQGKSLYARKNEQGDLQIVQLLSTDPQDFLNASFAPGSVLRNESVQRLK